MKNLALIISFFVAAVQLFAQSSIDSPMIQAENGFIAMAREKNTVEAFMRFLSDSAVTFNQKGPRKGKDHLKQQTPDQSLLSWAPGYTDMSHSGTWGFNIGPWNYRPQRTSDTAVAFGHFITVWRKERDGMWRAAIDIGVSHPKPTAPEPLLSSNILSAVLKSLTTRDEALQIEKAFAAQLGGNQREAYAKNLSSEGKLFRNGEFPMQKSDAILQFIDKQKSTPVYSPVDGDVSPNGDMLFVYGTATIEEVKDGKPVTRQANYMRIWKNEKGQGWKIVVDILT